MSITGTKASGVLSYTWSRSSSARNEADEHGRFRVTHPFHPLFGREFELLQYSRCWAEDRVFYRDGDGELLSLPASWTSAAAGDPFVAISAGRSPFRVVDLLSMAELVARADESPRPQEVARDV